MADQALEHRFSVHSRLLLVHSARFRKEWVQFQPLLAEQRRKASEEQVETAAGRDVETSNEQEPGQNSEMQNISGPLTKTGTVTQLAKQVGILTFMCWVDHDTFFLHFTHEHEMKSVAEMISWLYTGEQLEVWGLEGVENRSSTEHEWEFACFLQMPHYQNFIMTLMLKEYEDVEGKYNHFMDAASIRGVYETTKEAYRRADEAGVPRTVQLRDLVIDLILIFKPEEILSVKKQEAWEELHAAFPEIQSDLDTRAPLPTGGYPWDPKHRQKYMVMVVPIEEMWDDMIRECESKTSPQERWKPQMDNVAWTRKDVVEYDHLVRKEELAERLKKEDLWRVGERKKQSHSKP